MKKTLDIMNLKNNPSLLNKELVWPKHPKHVIFGFDNSLYICRKEKGSNLN